MAHDYNVVLMRKDGSVRNFRIYGQPRPNEGDVIILPVEGHAVRARIDKLPQTPEISQSVEQILAVEV